MSTKKTILAMIFLACATMEAASKVVTYNAPTGAELGKGFVVRVREAGKEWKNVDTYAVNVDKVVGTKHQIEKASMAYFDFDGEVEVEVSPTNGDIKESRIRPLSYGIASQADDKKLTFKLDRPRNISVEINGDTYHNLHLFANSIDTSRPKKTKAKGLIYFAPGLHKLPGDTLAVTSGTNVYIAGGAVVDGCLKVRGANGVKISGRGIIRPERRGAGIEISNSKNVSVEGIITTQCPTGGSDSVKISNVKAISSYNWGDGMNVFASSNVTFDGVFCRNSDDCTTVYATRCGFTGGCKNILMENSTLWADVAHPIFIGLHGNSPAPDTIDGVTYRNIDILKQAENQIDYQGCMAINAGDNNTVRNVRFENIRVESIDKGQLVNMRVCFNKKYCSAPGMGIDNVVFKDITYNGKEPNLSVITGYDSARKITNVRFENLKINGEVISDDMPTKPKWYKTSDMAHMFVGEHVENITFSK